MQTVIKQTVELKLSEFSLISWLRVFFCFFPQYELIKFKKNISGVIKKTIHPPMQPICIYQSILVSVLLNMTVCLSNLNTKNLSILSIEYVTVPPPKTNN